MWMEARFISDFAPDPWGEPGHWEWKRAVKTFEAATCRLHTLEPLARAWEAGLFCFWVLERREYARRTIIAVPRPAETPTGTTPAEAPA